MRPFILLFISSCCMLLFGFKQQGSSAPDEKLFLDIVSAHYTMHAYNHAVKVAIVQCVAMPFNPNAQPRPGSKDTAAHNLSTSHFLNDRLYNTTSTDTATHGLKVYKLFVKDENAYAYNSWQPNGQFLIKATWHYKETKQPTVKQDALAINDSVYLQPTDKGEYFIMYKAGMAGYETDKGWVYGIVNAEGTKVINKGLIKSCMNCHDESQYDRMLRSH